MQKYSIDGRLLKLSDNGVLQDSLCGEIIRERTHDVYLASAVDAEVAARAERDARYMDELDKRDARIAELEKALRYWMPDETLVESKDVVAWDEHIKLLQRKLMETL